MSEPDPGPTRGGPQLIPRPPGVVPGPGAWWSRYGALPPAVVPLQRVRWAFRSGPGGGDGPETVGSGAVGSADTVGSNTVGSHIVVPGAVSAGDPGAGWRVAAGPQGGPEVADSILDNGVPMADPTPAAVLCAVFEEDNDTWVILTRRSSRLRSHTGEVAFPGGRLDPAETPVEAALREAEEEVGIDPAAVEVIGTLPLLSTMTSRATITPIVGVLAHRPRLRPNPAEVDRAFAVPLSELMAPGVYHEERWAFADGGDRGIHFFDLPGDTVWGATGRMLRDLLDRVYPTPDRPAA